MNKPKKISPVFWIVSIAIYIGVIYSLATIEKDHLFVLILWPLAVILPIFLPILAWQNHSALKAEAESTKKQTEQSQSQTEEAMSNDDEQKSQAAEGFVSNETDASVVKKDNNHQIENDIIILRGNADAKPIDHPVFKWSGKVGEDLDLVFRCAYEIAPPHFGEEISNLSFRVHNREFQDLSFLNGVTLQKCSDRYEIRKHADGTKFVFSYSNIPTFDLSDRVWDSMSHLAAYADEAGINIVFCKHGYKIPCIMVYVGLVKSIPAFTELLKKLGCEDFTALK